MNELHFQRNDKNILRRTQNGFKYSYLWKFIWQKQYSYWEKRKKLRNYGKNHKHVLRNSNNGQGHKIDVVSTANEPETCRLGSVSRKTTMCKNVAFPSLTWLCVPSTCIKIHGRIWYSVYHVFPCYPIWGADSITFLYLLSFSFL